MHNLGGIRLAMQVVGPHALLIRHKEACEYCIPVPDIARQCAGMRSDLVRTLWAAIELRRPRPAEANAMEIESLTPGFLLENANFLRQHLHGIACPDGSREPLQKCIDALCGMREGMLDTSSMVHQRAFAMEHLLNCLLAGGFLKAATGLRSSLLFGLRAAVRDEQVREFYEDLLVSPHAVPSATTLIRHRLTIHLAWCVQQQGILGSMLDRGGLTRFGTLDGSPQSGYDWEHCGYVTISDEDLLLMRDYSQLLLVAIRFGEPGDQERPDVKEAFTELSKRLVLQLNPPGATGSGASGVWHKAHVVCHTTRLTAPSWEASAKLMNATFTWCGDLGTESGFTNVKVDLRRLFGAWITKRGSPWAPPKGQEDGATGQSGAATPGPDADMPFVIRSDRDIESADAAPDNGPDFDVRPDAVAFDDNLEDAGDSMFHVLPDVDSADAAHQPILRRPNRIDHSDFEPSARPAGSDDNPYYVNLEHSLYIPGMLHIVAKISENLSLVLVVWPSWIPRVKEVTRMLKKKHTKSRLLQTCFSAPPHLWYRTNIEAFDKDCYDGRWNSILSANDDLLECQGPLQDGFDLHKYSRGKVDNDGAGADKASRSIKLDVVSAAIGDPYFWACCRLTSFLGECLLQISTWSEQCPCHWTAEVNVHGSRRQFLAERQRLLFGSSRCPLRCMRAAEAAAGDFMQYVRKLLSMASTVFRTHYCMRALTGPQQAQLLADFSNGKRFILFSLMIKTSFWQQLPYALCGISHFDYGMAKVMVQRCFDLYDRFAGPAIRSFWWCEVLLKPESEGRKILQAWVDDVAAEFPPGGSDTIVTRMIARMTFVMLSERWIESMHSLSNKFLTQARHAGVVHLGFSLLFPTLAKDLEPAGALVAFAQHAERTKNIKLALENVGLQWHPQVVRLFDQVGGLGSGRLFKDHRPDLIRVIYHLDAPTLFEVEGAFDARSSPPTVPGPAPEVHLGCEHFNTSNERLVVSISARSRTKQLAQTTSTTGCGASTLFSSSSLLLPRLPRTRTATMTTLSSASALALLGRVVGQRLCCHASRIS